MNFKTGEPKNNTKLLELGKEVTQGVIERFEDSYYGYVRLEDIKDETLILIGKKIYSDTEALLHHIRNIYEEDNFHWNNEVYDSFDEIVDIVSSTITASGEYYLDNNSDMYLLVTNMDEVDTKEKLTEKISNIEKYVPLTIMLNKEKSEFIFIMLSDNEKEYVVEKSLKNGKFEKSYFSLNNEEFLNLINEIESIILKYDNPTEKFKLNVEKELNKLIDINSFHLPEVLPKNIEYTIIHDYIKDVVVDFIKHEESESIGHTELQYLWDKSERYIDRFLTEGSLKNLTEDELKLIYSGALDYKEEESIKTISIRYLREYFMNILLEKNNAKNKFDLIALYYLILEDMEKIEPYISNMLDNGFSIEDLNNRVRNLKCANPFIKKEVAEEFKSIFKSYIYKNKNIQFKA